MNLDKNLPSKKKLFVYIGALVLVAGQPLIYIALMLKKKRQRTNGFNN